MPKFSRLHLVLWLLSGAVVLSSVACSRSQSSRTVVSSAPATDTPVTNTSPAVTAANPASPDPAPNSTQADAYKLALEKANRARNLSQSALSEDDWNLVTTRWQQAIASLKAIPPASPYQKMAAVKLAEFEKGLAAAQGKAKQAKASTTGPSNPGLIVGGAGSLNVSSALKSTSPQSGKIYRAPIKRRAGGTPIIDVTFNGDQTFEMIVDTGASGTVITGEMARSLGVRVIGKTKVNTASQSGVEVPLGYIDSIAVGGAVVKEVIVAIGNDALDIGLLGHDFFNDFDVTVKQDVVEFRKR